jgi:integrase
MARREQPIKRRNPSGDVRWVARWTTKDGKRKSAGTFKLKREAQDAIDAAYEAEAQGPLVTDTLGRYFETWLENHPRSARSNRTYDQRIKAVLGIEIEGRELRDWEFDDLRRKHVAPVINHMLKVHKRTYTGANSILASLSTMTRDAIYDEVALRNPWKGAAIRPNDTRIEKDRPQIRVWSWEQMHDFARACGDQDNESRAIYGEIMVRCLSDCGMRIGELLGLRRQDVNAAELLLEIRQTADEKGRVLAGTKEDRLRNRSDGMVGRDVPVPPDLLAMLVAMPKRIDTPMLFPMRSGRAWDYKSFRDTIWDCGRAATGTDPRPHEYRHSYVTHMRAAGVNDADLAQITGHTVLTMQGRYAHSLGRSFEDVRRAVGS